MIKEPCRRFFSKSKKSGLTLTILLVLLSILSVAIHHNTNGEAERVPILAEMALEVAHEDAKQHYRDLSIYDVVIELEGQNWRVDYNLKDPTINGGGPHYLISGTDGSILMRRYSQ